MLYAIDLLHTEYLISDPIKNISKLIFNQKKHEKEINSMCCSKS